MPPVKPKSSIELDENSSITIPIRNLIAMGAAVVVAVVGYFDVANRIDVLERENILLRQEVGMNSEFRIKWPRGELGSLPDDLMQNAHLSSLDRQMHNLEEDAKEINELRILINRENGINQTQNEKIETLFDIWNNSIVEGK